MCAADEEERDGQEHHGGGLDAGLLRIHGSGTSSVAAGVPHRGDRRKRHKPRSLTGEIRGTMLAMRLLLALAAALVLAQPAEARISLGVLGNSGRFASQTGQHSEVRHVILGWGQGASWGARLSVQFASHGPVPLVAFTTSRGWPHPYEAITPLAVARGSGDDYLGALNKAIAEWARPVFIRPFPEMNGHWNDYSAFNRRRLIARAPELDRSVPQGLRANRTCSPAAARPTKLNAKPAAAYGTAGGRGGASRPHRRASSGTRRATAARTSPANSPQAYYPGDRVCRRGRQ